MTRALDSPLRRWYHRRVRVLRYGADATWIFRGYDTPPVESAFLTIKDTWATPAEEQGPEPPRLQLAVTPTLSPDGIVTTDEDGNWVAAFNFSADETAVELEPGSPATRYLFYEVTLMTATQILRPFVGQVRMLPDVYTPAASS